MTTNDSEWYKEWQRVTMSDYEWYSKWQWMTSDSEWERVKKKGQWVTANDSDKTNEFGWEWVN